MKIAVYYDVPFGGAKVAMSEILSILKISHSIKEFHLEEPSFRKSLFLRFKKDLNSIFFSRVNSKKLAKEIDLGEFDLVFVSHDRHFQAPWLLRYLNTKTVFLCQEPTRAFFEDFLKPSPSLPLINKLYEQIIRFIKKRIEIKNASFATKIISNSRYSEKTIFNAYGLHSTPIYMGVNTSKFFPVKTMRKNQVLVIGNNEPQKNISLAIDALALIEEDSRPELCLVSPRANSVTDLLLQAKRLKVKLTLNTKITTQKLRRLYSQSKLLLAVAKLEPFGMSVVESLACGTPVVAISQGGFLETIVDGETGLLVAENPNKLAKTISTALDNKTDLIKMGQKGILDVKKRFKWENTVSSFEKIFYEII